MTLTSNPTDYDDGVTGRVEIDVAAAARLGDTVLYTGSDGRIKAALVVATAANGEHIHACEAGLIIFGRSGSVYFREAIPAGKGPHSWAPRP